jgi:hypothetical protein
MMAIVTSAKIVLCSLLPLAYPGPIGGPGDQEHDDADELQFVAAIDRESDRGGHPEDQERNDQRSGQLPWYQRGGELLEQLGCSVLE